MTGQVRANGHARREQPEALQPDLLIEYLYYAFQDVRAVSERGARQLHNAIATLAEEARATRRGRAA